MTFPPVPKPEPSKERIDPVTDEAGGDSGFPRWGSMALPAAFLWGAAIGAAIGWVAGNVLIGLALGAALGVGIGVYLFAAAIVQASRKI